MMTDDELKAIRERLEAATPGPWEIRDADILVVGPDDDDVCELFDAGWPSPSAEQARVNGEFIAHAPTDIAALLAEVERLQERCEQLYYDGLQE